jgi:hypothetical protein
MSSPASSPTIWQDCGGVSLDRLGVPDFETSAMMPPVVCQKE